MQYQDFHITVSVAQAAGYGATVQGAGLAPLAALLPRPATELGGLMARVLNAPLAPESAGLSRRAGEMLFRWLLSGGGEAQLRLARSQAEAQLCGLRLRLQVHAPELAGWPWELLHDPQRDYPFAASSDTLLVRFVEPGQALNGAARLRVEAPITVLLALPHASDLNLQQERKHLEALARALPGVLRLRILEGVVTQTHLTDALLSGVDHILHFGGHSAFVEGKGYIRLNTADGRADWVEAGVVARLAMHQPALKLMVLNGCATGQVNDTRALQGLAPQLVGHGVPAVVAMQHAISDQAAATFTREFYKRLCAGHDAGQVDVAIAYARNMLAILNGNDLSWLAPVLFTQAPDGVVFRLPFGAARAMALDPVDQRTRLAALTASLQTSLGQMEDWAFSDRAQRVRWRVTLRQAAEAYRRHLADERPEIRQVAQQGLHLAQARLAALDTAERGPAS